MKSDANPMSAASSTPRCNSRLKRTSEPCAQPSVKGWKVCRFHGAGGGYKAVLSHTQWKRGIRSRAWVEQRKRIITDVIVDQTKGPEPMAN